ncbi:MAG TPA: division/cell wall cluster transcriptional repressor MraZ [Acidimicrobiales bacterium]|nr:division/cell wall cluster transcriptional repressor MraZ [Acidimicrobiales bacterium]
MFFGEFDHSLDAKGRVILPAEFRDRLEDGGFITKNLDGCLAIYTTEEFQEVAAGMQEKARRGPTERNVARSFAAGTRSIKPDKQGRVAIPAHLRDFAGLERDVKVTGAINRIEIWDAQRWIPKNQEGEAMLAGSQPGLDDLGI